jgi:predicted DNA-binding transcriptional regulator AlpA
MPKRTALRLPAVCRKVCMGKTQILEAVEKGNFPKPYRPLPEGRAIAWDEDEIDQHLEAQMAKRDEVAA